MPIYEVNGKQYNIPKDKINEFLKARPQARPVINSLPVLFESQVEKTPDAIAVVYEGVQLTYKELNERANQLAYYLIDKHSIQTNDRVALCLDRNEHMLIAILAVLKSGAGYVPLDPQIPDERITYMIQDTAPKAILTQKIFRKRIDGVSCTYPVEIIDDDSVTKKIQTQYPVMNPDQNIFPEHLAYIIYTSGTTGNPKGVMTEHRNIVNFVTVYNELFDSVATDQKRYLWYANYAFDAHILDVYRSLTTGGTLYIIGGDTRLDLQLLHQYISENNIDTACIPPILLDKDHVLPLKNLLVVGEVTNPEIIESYLQKNTSIFNGYGPTEITVCSHIHKFSAQEKNTTLGKSLRNYTTYILDENQQPLPPGAVGELYIGGAGVSRGYLNNPELTAERFLPNPFQTQEEKERKLNDRIYKTGDLVKILPGEIMEYMGRNDFQVKIRGFRIETGEIEARLAAYPGIKQTAILVKEPNSGMKYLAAYYVSDSPLDTETLSEYLSQYLPDYMIPSAFMHMEKMPMNSNGKLDKKALPEPELTNSTTYRAPQTPIEKQLCSLYSEILNIEESTISTEDDFFRLGGNSILAIKLVNKINLTLNKNISIATIFTHKNIRNLAANLPDAPHDAIQISGTQVKKPQDQLLSFAQERLWFIESYEGGSNAYNIPLLFKLKDNVSLKSLISAIHAVIKRHEILRTLIRQTPEGTSYQEVMDGFSFSVAERNLSSPEELSPAFTRAANHIFKLDREYPIQAEIFTLTNARYISIVAHHIAFDGWSTEILFKDISGYYSYYESIGNNSPETSASKPLPDLPIQYKDFALWQRNHLTGEFLTRQIDFWKDQLNGYEELTLPTDNPRPSRIDYSGADVYFTIDETISSGLRNIARESGVSLYSVLLSGYYILLSVYSNQKDLVVGTPVANRNYKELENLIGFFVNTLVLRQQIDKNQSIIDFIKQTGNLSVEVQNYQELPFEKLVQELDVKQDTSRHPVFQVMFGMNDFGNGQHKEMEQLLDLNSMEGESGYSIAKFDLTVMLKDSATTIQGSFNYATSLFNEETIQSYIVTYQNILSQLSSLNPADSKQKSIGELIYLKDQQYKKIIHTWNPVPENQPISGTIKDMFELQVQKTPDHIACVFENKKLTYKELNSLSNQWAAYLKNTYQIQPDDLIALCLDRSENIPLAILAVLKTGAAYVPMASNSPTDRLSYMIQDTSPKVVLTTLAHQENINDLSEAISVETIDSPVFLEKVQHLSGENLPTSFAPENLAYIIYTSGTTGTPKGVMVEHKNVIHLFMSGTKLYNFAPTDTWTLFHSYTFDFSVWELWGALLFGGKLVIPNHMQTLNPEAFYNLCQEEGVTILNQTPSAFYQFIDAAVHKKETISSLRYVIFGGESLNTTQLKPWYEIYPETAPYLVNMYGITETTVFATYPKPLQISDCDKIPLIGKPMEGYTAYVLDENKQPVPVGAIGELYVGGKGVTRGYLNNRELTAERFISNPFSKETGNTVIYKSGDLVRFLPDGNLEYIGRNDFQVKIRGFRIELEEIEAKLSSYPGIKQSVVLVTTHSSDVKYLVAYYVSDTSLDSNLIRNHMGNHLPEYMIPTFFIHLSKLPLTINGKLDKRALPQPDITENRTYIAPENAIEKELCDIYAKVLNLPADSISTEDDFFELGGNSIIATKLIYQINAAFQIKIKIVDLFISKTIKNIALLIDQNIYQTLVQLNSSDSPNTLFMVHPGGGGCEAYLSLAQKLTPFYSCYGLDSYNLYHENKIDDLHTLANYYLKNMGNVKTHLPYHLLGWSLGGLIALEIASILESKGVTNLTVYLLDTVINDKDKSIQVSIPSDEKIQELVDKYKGLEFQSVKNLLTIENELTNQSISQKLKHTKIVLFKAMLSNKDRNESNFYMMDNIVTNRDQLKVIKMEHSTHDTILEEEGTLVQNIIENSYSYT